MSHPPESSQIKCFSPPVAFSPAMFSLSGDPETQISALCTGIHVQFSHAELKPQNRMSCSLETLGAHSTKGGVGLLRRQQSGHLCGPHADASLFR